MFSILLPLARGQLIFHQFNFFTTASRMTHKVRSANRTRIQVRKSHGSIEYEIYYPEI